MESYKTFVSSFINEKYAYYSQTQNNDYEEEYDKNLRTPCMNILKVLLRSHNNLFREIDYLTKGVIFTAYQKNETKEEVTTKICERWLLSQLDSLKKGSAKYKDSLESKECKFRDNGIWCHQTLRQNLEACIAELRQSAPLWKIQTFNYGGVKNTQITKISFKRGSFELTDDSVLESDEAQTRKNLKDKLESYIRSIELERKKLT